MVLPDPSLSIFWVGRVGGEPLPLTLRLAACVSLLGLLGIGYQVWQGMPAPVKWIPAEPEVIHPALLLQPELAGEPTPTDAPRMIADWKEQRMRGTDDNGRSVFFRVMVLAPKFRWRPGSATLVIDGDREAVLANFPMKHSLVDELSSSRAVLTLGSDEETREDHLLSTDRARNLGKWFEQSSAGAAPVYGIDIGRHSPESAPPAEQIGRILIVGVPVLDPGADLAAALWNALVENEETPLNVRLYSRFDLIPLEDDSTVHGKP